MNTKLYLISSVLMWLSASSALAQQKVTPLPRPKGSGASLLATTDFIVHKLTDVGKVNFIAFVTTTTDQSTYQHHNTRELTNVRFTSPCVLSYHYSLTIDDKAPGTVDITIGFTETESIVVEQEERFLSEINAKAGHPEWVVSTTQPQTFVLRFIPNKKVDADSDFLTFHLQDANLADRLAKAMTHVIELCGGGNRDPY
jgi:hypothetical protein